MHIQKTRQHLRHPSCTMSRMKLAFCIYIGCPFKSQKCIHLRRVASKITNSNLANMRSQFGVIASAALTFVSLLEILSPALIFAEANHGRIDPYRLIGRNIKTPDLSNSGSVVKRQNESTSRSKLDSCSSPASIILALLRA